MLALLTSKRKFDNLRLNLGSQFWYSNGYDDYNHYCGIYKVFDLRFFGIKKTISESSTMTYCEFYEGLEVY